MSSPATSSEAPLEANKSIRVHSIGYRSYPKADSRPGHTNCNTLDRFVQLIPADWTWTRSILDYNRITFEQLLRDDGGKKDLLGENINLEDVYGSKVFREKMGLADWDVSGKGVWVTKGLLNVWTKLLKRYMEKGTWSEITDKPNVEVYKPRAPQLRLESWDIVEIGTEITGKLLLLCNQPIAFWFNDCLYPSRNVRRIVYSDEIGYISGYTNDGTVDQDVKFINSTLPDKEHWHLSRTHDINKPLLESWIEDGLDIMVGGKRGYVCPRTYDGRWWTKDLLQAHTKAKTKACKDDEEKRFTEEKIRLWMKDLHVAEDRVSDV